MFVKISQVNIITNYNCGCKLFDRGRAIESVVRGFSFDGKSAYELKLELGYHFVMLFGISNLLELVKSGDRWVSCFAKLDSKFECRTKVWLTDSTVFLLQVTWVNEYGNAPAMSNQMLVRYADLFTHMEMTWKEFMEQEIFSVNNTMLLVWNFNFLEFSLWVIWSEIELTMFSLGLRSMRNISSAKLLMLQLGDEVLQYSFLVIQICTHLEVLKTLYEEVYIINLQLKYGSLVNWEMLDTKPLRIGVAGLHTTLHLARHSIFCCCGGSSSLFAWMVGINNYNRVKAPFVKGNQMKLFRNCSMSVTFITVVTRHHIRVFGLLIRNQSHFGAVKVKHMLIKVSGVVCYDLLDTSMIQTKLL